MSCGCRDLVVFVVVVVAVIVVVGFAEDAAGDGGTGARNPNLPAAASLKVVEITTEPDRIAANSVLELQLLKL